MIATRFAIFAVAATLSGAAWGAIEMSLQPSAQRLVLTAVTGLLAPLFWPGAAPTLGRTAMRIAAWSTSSAFLALVVLRITGGTRQPFTRLATAGAMLMLILLVTHALAAGIERWLRDRSDSAQSAREMAGRITAVSVAIVGAVPLWLGPAGEMLARAHPWTIDAVIGMSPLTHLAVASGNDLLRNQWFYQHSNLAALRYSYPSLTTLTATYVAIVLTLLLVTLATRRSGRATGSTTSTHLTTEHAK